MRQFPTTITSNRLLAEDTFELEFAWQSDEVPLPGQFFTLRCSDSSDPLLRRPFAFSSFDPHSARASCVYLRRGSATVMLSQLATGAKLDVLGPLGRGFQPPAEGEAPVLLAGGIGLGPILFLRDSLCGRGAEPLFLYGARNAAFVPRDRLPRACLSCTDDGSLGFKGTVVDSLLDAGIPVKAALYACGPGPMLKAIAALARTEGLPCQVAVEQRMACGVGACMGCSVAVKDERKFARACVEGPVFRAEELLWD